MDSEKYIRNKNREFVKRTKQSLDITTVVLQKTHCLQSNSKSSFKNCSFLWVIIFIHSLCPEEASGTPTES